MFLVVHAIYVRYFAREKGFAEPIPGSRMRHLPERVPRHSLAARLFHWIMAAAMFMLLFTAFLPKVGIQFNWVAYHWIAGSVLTVSIHFSHHPRHLLPGLLVDLAGQGGPGGCMEAVPALHGTSRRPAAKVCQVSAGEQALSWRVMLAGLAVIATGVFMMLRVRTDLLPAQSVSVQRHDVGPDVRPARIGGRGTDRAGHGARVLCDSAGEAAHYRIDDLRLDEPRVLSRRSTTRNGGW